MRRLSGAFISRNALVAFLGVAGALFMLPAFSQGELAQDAAAQPAAQDQKKPAGPELKYSDDTVIVAYAINPGKEADYEKVLAMLKDALAKNPARATQAAGWKVYKSAKPLTADGPTYIHVINVDRSADYSITNIVYESLDDQGKIDFFNLYKGALNKPLMQIGGALNVDLK
jgi:hypothetical protein